MSLPFFGVELTKLTEPHWLNVRIIVAACTGSERSPQSDLGVTLMSVRLVRSGPLIWQSIEITSKLSKVKVLCVGMYRWLLGAVRGYQTEVMQSVTKPNKGPMFTVMYCLCKSHLPVCFSFHYCANETISYAVSWNSCELWVWKSQI